jgi:hypothetical protein
MAAPIAERTASGIASAMALNAERTATLTVTVVPRSESGVFRDTTLVYLDGRIDDDAPDRLSRALVGVNGRTAIWLNSPGGNLFAGMQTYIIDSRVLLPGACYSARARWLSWETRIASTTRGAATEFTAPHCDPGQPPATPIWRQTSRRRSRAMFARWESMPVCSTCG